MLSGRPDHVDIVLKAWSDRARLQPDEAEAVCQAVLRRAAAEALALEAVGKKAGVPTTVPPWKVALAVASEAVVRARSPLWGSSWVPPLRHSYVG
jgi:hypothetical protein